MKLNAGVWLSIGCLAAANLVPMPDRVGSSGVPVEARAFEKAQIPLNLGEWRGEHLEVEDRTVEILETDDVALMAYHKPDAQQPVWLAHVAGLGQRAAFHPPELCYIGSHFEVVERGPIEVAGNDETVSVMRLLLNKEGENFLAWYWFTAEDRMTVNYYHQQWWLVQATFLGRKPSGSLVRISTPADDVAAAHERLKSFLIKMRAR